MSPMTQLLGWALVHFVWQGAVLAIATAAVLRLASRPALRYLVGCAGLLPILAAPVARSRGCGGAAPSHHLRNGR